MIYFLETTRTRRKGTKMQGMDRKHVLKSVSETQHCRFEKGKPEADELTCTDDSKNAAI